MVTPQTQKIKMKHVGLLIITLFVLIILGCSDGKVRLGGKVTYSDDGTPLETGTVGFTTATYNARGSVQEDGTFVISSEKPGDGLPPGTYRVHISGADRQIGIDGEGNPIWEPLIAPKFTSPDTSGLTLEVTPQTTVYNIEVDRYVPSKKR